MAEDKEVTIKLLPEERRKLATLIERVLDGKDKPEAGFPIEELRELLPKFGGDEFLYSIEEEECDELSDIDYFMLRYQNLPVLIVPIGAPFLSKARALDVAQMVKKWMTSGSEKASFWGMFDAEIKRKEEALKQKRSRKNKGNRTL